jgi:nicotinamide-nucleotide amidase
MQQRQLCTIMAAVSQYAEDIATSLLARALTIGTVESATGGLISNLLTNIPGSSNFYKGSIVSYSNEIKTGMVGVDAAVIEADGAVSAAVAEQMAAGGRRLLNVDICLSDTGIAGPGGSTAAKPVGLFYLGFACSSGVYNRRFVFDGDRTANKQAAAEAALGWLREFLSGEWTPGLSRA